MSTFRRTEASDPHASKVPAITVVACALLIGYELLCYWAADSAERPQLGPWLALAPVAVVCLLLLRTSLKYTLIALALVGAVAFVAHLLKPHAPTLYAFYPLSSVLGYGFCLWLFGRTLRSGHEALVTRLARIVHGRIEADLAAYTRRVTWAWCVFFAAMASTSLLLYAFAPLNSWAFFTNVLNIPLVVLMFIVEYLYRVLRYPHFPHATPLAAANAFRRFGRRTPFGDSNA